jgi:DnaA-homolog protein
MQQIALDMVLATSPTLDNFHAGRSEDALAHLKLWTSSAQPTPVPTYLWGESGCGKSHLLQAVTQALRDRGASVGRLDAQTSPHTPFQEHWNAVVMDDVHLFDTEQQHLAFNWFVNAQTARVWVLAAGLVPPADLPLREDLRTRLGWGHVFALHALSEAERRAVLRQEADARGVFLSDEVMSFMLVRFSRDLASLMQLLDQLDRFALALKRPITIPLIKSMLEQL